MKRLFLTLICTGSLLIVPQQLLLIPATQVTAQETTKKVLSSAQLQDLAKSITVKILTKNGSASGTLIAKNGNNYTILTNDHVINPGESYRIQAPDGKIYPATVIKEKPPSIKNQDAALFQFLSTVEYTIATLGTSAPIAVNQKIVAAGFVNDSAKLVFTEGQISLLPDKSFQRGYRIGYNNKIQPGMSGGPILNYQGEVIGINAVHAYPISDKIYTYIDNSKPSAAERQQMRQYSWGLPIYSVAKIVPEFVAKSPIKIDNSGLRVKKGLIQNIDQIAQEITVLIPNANPNDIGSGVIIAQKGNIYYVLTADHVIWNRDEKKLKNKLEIVAPDNQRYALNVSNAKRMPGVDLAVVQFTSNQKYQVTTLANYSLNTKGQKVFVSGFPGNKQQNQNKPHRILTAGILSQQQFIKLNTYLSFNNQSSLIPVQIQTVLSDGYDLLYSNITKGGMSGGAVLDTEGRLIGIHGRVEGEISLDFDGEINLGSSSGVPIRTFLNLVEQVGIDSDLKVETTAPATLKKSEEDVISEYLLPLDQVPKNSDDEILWLNYANQLWRSQKYAEAIKAVDKAISKKPDFYQAWYFKGVIFDSEKKYPESIAAYDKALKINPNFAQAWKDRGRLLLALDKYSEALTSFDKAIALSPNQFDLYHWRGFTLHYLKRFPEAIEAYNQSIKIDPLFKFAYNGRVSSYVELKNYRQAITDLTQAVQLDPKDAVSYLMRGSVYLVLEEYKQSIADSTQAIQLDPKKALYYNVRGSAYEGLKEYKQAIADYTQAIQLDPKNAKYYNSRGIAYTQLKDYKQVIADYTQAIQLDPKDATYYGMRGGSYLVLEDYKQAIADFTQAIQLDPKDAIYHSLRGLAYSKLKDYKQAISDLTETIRRDPQNAPYTLQGLRYSEYKDYKGFISSYTGLMCIAYTTRGGIYYDLKEYKLAIDDFTQAIKIDPKDARYYVIRGNSYFLLKEYKQGIDDLTQAIKIDSQNEAYYVVRGGYYLQLKDYKQAIDDYTQAIKLDPKNAGYYGARGLAYLQLKDYKQAINDYTQAIQLDPKNAGYYGARGDAYLQLKDYKQAINDYSQAIKLKPDFTEAYYVRGIAHYFLKDYKQAINDYTQAIKLKPDYPEAYTNLGIVSYEMGEVETAINYWRNAIKINSNFAEAHLALGVALYGKGDQEAGLKSAETALKLDKRYGKIEFLKENGWGEKLIINTQLFLQNPRIKALI
ncbi:tetratricopeptide repeat protein [Anabaena sp. FACHB-1250]|uniref:serine protease n=1 Tax=Anabaena sp. FACHB-1250 TaxID=2692770 RepID=UPI001681B92D|nr:serine protease [Anabaena sp. FACHB-1250]MBD2140296.1 tetratricopeptide repeat protein [Anabaena sp. FACHB-1250]